MTENRPHPNHERRITMKRNRSWLITLVAAVMSGMPAYAHHPVASVYFSDRTEGITGALVEFQLRNPHSFVYLEAPDQQGRVQRWAVEWLSVMQLSRQGVTASTLKPGDRLVITGYPARS